MHISYLLNDSTMVEEGIQSCSFHMSVTHHLQSFIIITIVTITILVLKKTRCSE